MKLGAVFSFEFKYQIRRAWPWLIFGALGIIAYLMTRDGSLSEALYDDFYVNSPFLIAKSTVVCTFFWLVSSAVVAGESGARDVATGAHPLTFTTPLSKLDYLGGRFLAAFALNVLLLLSIPLGIFVGVYVPAIDAAIVGPVRPEAYLTAFAYLTLPNAFFGTAVQFAFAVRTGRPMAAYLGSMALFFTAFFVAGLLLWQREVGALLDPIGLRLVLSDFSHDWTTAEKATRLVALEGSVLKNRLVWLSVGVLTLVLTYVRFEFSHRAESRPWWRRWRRDPAAEARPSANASAVVASISVPPVPRSFGLATHVQQVRAIAWQSFRAIAATWTGRALFFFIPALSILIVADQVSALGSPIAPTTMRVLQELTAPLSDELSRWVIVPLLIVFFAGELVWREREAGLGEITDATPGSSWAPLLGKFGGIAIVLAVFVSMQIVSGVLAQTLLDYRQFELGLYLKVMFGLQLPEYLLFTVLALTLHVVANQKYVGHLLAIVAYVFIALASLFGVEHNLLIFGAGPDWAYTEMRGFGGTVGPWLWFKLYWTMWAVLFAVVASVFWMRGKDTRFATRRREARRRFVGATPRIAAGAATLVVLLGGFVFYNTNILNEYETSAEVAERSAEYERRYSQFARVPQPSIGAATLAVDIHPSRRAFDVRGTYTLVNRGRVAVDSVFVATALGVETSALEFDRAVTRAVVDTAYGQSLFVLERPLAPGDAVRLTFSVHAQRRGFRESTSMPSVVANGSFFINSMLPEIGYQASRQLIGAGDRREHGLPASPPIAALNDPDEPKKRNGGINLATVISTEAGQTAIAPGTLLRSWSENGREYFEYRSDAPIGGEWAFFSARYDVLETSWNDVAIRVYHDPEHTEHLDFMVRGIKESLALYSEIIAPYPYKQLTVVERPGEGIGAHADPGLVYHSEGFAHWKRLPDTTRLDFPFAVMGHEMAHQWVVPIARVEGAPVIAEGIAWYYAAQLVRRTSGFEHHRRLMSFFRQPYPHAPIRRGEPLLRGLDPYMSYRRMPFALNALAEYVGEPPVNAALRRLYERHKPDSAPLATTLDMYRDLQAVTPDSLKYLLGDLFERNTYWEFKTERVDATQLPDSTWEVTLDVEARKVVYDSAGVESEVALDEWIPIGVFGVPGPGQRELMAPLYHERHRVRSGAQRITVRVAKRPVLAGIDPYHVLDWIEGEDDDNIEEVRQRP